MPRFVVQTARQAPQLALGNQPLQRLVDGPAAAQRRERGWREHGTACAALHAPGDLRVDAVG